MNEKELKDLVGEKAFEAMSPEQRNATISKYDTIKKESEPPKKESELPKKEDGDPSLREEVKKDKEAKAAKDAEVKALETAIAFNYGVENFVKDSIDVLPENFDTLLKRANEKKYDSQNEKASAIKVAFIEEFFIVQANVELLTHSQKSQLEDFLKLTENGKKQRSNHIFENLFEPALETLKKVKKAEELGKARSGFASSSKAEDKYKEKLIAHSQKALLHKGDK